MVEESTDTTPYEELVAKDLQLLIDMVVENMPPQRPLKEQLREHGKVLIALGVVLVLAVAGGIWYAHSQPKSFLPVLGPIRSKLSKRPILNSL